MDGDEMTARRLVDELWFRVDVRRDAITLLVC